MTYFIILTMQAIVQDLLVNYNEQGEGKTVLLLHGWGDSLETFRFLTPELGKYYRLVSLDLPGFGKSQAPQEVWNLDNYAKFVADFVAKILPQDTVLAMIGHSNGGAVIIRGLALNVFSPEKAVLLASSGVRDSGKTRRLVIKAVAKTGKAATFWLPQSTKKKLQKKLYGTVESDMLVTPELKETFKRTVRQDVQKDAEAINLPVLLLYGDGDTATPIEDVGAKLHKSIKGSKLQSVQGADHFVHHGRSTEVTSKIREFLN